LSNQDVVVVRPALTLPDFEKEQERQLLDIVAVRQPIIAQDVAVVPQFLDKLRGLFWHIRFEKIYVEEATTNEVRISQGL
jgi:hypothetical protein